MRLGTKRPAHASPNVTEARLLTLLGAGIAAAPAPAVRRATPERGAALRSVGRSAVVVAALGVVAFVTMRDGRVHPRPVDAVIQRESGSGRLVLPIVAGDTLLRVVLNPATDDPGAWFWCFDSEAGLPPLSRYCASSGTRDPVTGDISVAAKLHFDASLVTGTTFFVQTYCKDACRWEALASPATPDTDAAP